MKFKSAIQKLKSTKRFVEILGKNKQQINNKELVEIADGKSRKQINNKARIYRNTWNFRTNITQQFLKTNISITNIIQQFVNNLIVITTVNSRSANTKRNLNPLVSTYSRSLN